MTGALLAGRRALVTGGARGIGAAVARRFAEEGASVVLADIDTVAASSTAVDIAAATGQQVTYGALDVSDEGAVEDAFDEWHSELGPFDTVVANAGLLHLGETVTTDLADWNRVIAVNLTGAFLTVRAAARRMREGSITITSSLFGVRGGRENAAYSASKFGVIGLAQSLAAELAPVGIRVNSVCPGQIETEMMQRLVADRSSRLGVSEDEVRAGLLARVGMARMGTMDEVADTFVYLASDLGRYVTGQALVVDGGYQVG